MYQLLGKTSGGLLPIRIESLGTHMDQWADATILSQHYCKCTEICVGKVGGCSSEPHSPCYAPRGMSPQGISSASTYAKHLCSPLI